MHGTDADDQLLTTKECAALLAVHPVTLATWRLEAHKGPRFVKIGSAVRYRRSDIDAWLERQTRISTGPS